MHQDVQKDLDDSHCEKESKRRERERDREKERERGEGGEKRVKIS